MEANSIEHLIEEVESICVGIGDVTNAARVQAIRRHIAEVDKANASIREEVERLKEVETAALEVLRGGRRFGPRKSWRALQAAMSTKRKDHPDV